jgi:4-diphosphocytidyl-2-C-methyl-D-erythritol kinase
MVLFPNCKINLGLNIIAKRPDGYHDLETVFFPIALQDALEIIKAEAVDVETGIQFQSTGLTIAGGAENNLCVKAYGLLKKDFPELSPLQMHLHKAIPMGAGLGGGSADGAYTLQILNQYFQLNLSLQQLQEYALQLGSDCPFFIINKPCFATGRGEKMEEITLDLSAFQCILVHPGIHISTAWAFSQLVPVKPAVSVKEIIANPVNTWKDSLVNDFELPVMVKYPEIGRIKEQLYEQGAIYASLTGSGSTVFGLFPRNTRITLPVYPNYQVYKI